MENARDESHEQSKMSTGNIMNETYANWKKGKKETQEKRNSKNKSKNQTCNISNEIAVSLPKNSQKNSNSQSQAGYRGMTLEEYFKTKDQSEIKVEESTDENPFQKTYAQEQFEIHQTDQDNYSQTQKIVKTPQFIELPDISLSTTGGKQQLQSKLFNKYAKKTIKLKTQTHEQEDYSFSQYRSKQKSKKRFPTMIQEDISVPSKVEFGETFYKDENKKSTQTTQKIDKNRVISNPVQKKEVKARLITLSDFYKQQNHSLQKTKMLQKVHDEKSKLNDLHMNEIGYITKYAAKFHITKSVCKQLLREQQLRL